MARISRNIQRLREAGLLLLFLLLLFSYSGKPVLKTKSIGEKKQVPEKEIQVQTPVVEKTSQQFFRIKPRLFPLAIPGRKSKIKPVQQIQEKTLQSTEDREQRDFVFSPAVPWYQFYYFPGESDDYGVAG